MALDTSVLGSIPLFSTLSEAQIDRIAAQANVRRIEQGESVFEQGEQVESLHLLLHGRLKVVEIGREGQRSILWLVHPGEFLAITCALGRRMYPGTATAAVESIVAAWPQGSWDELASANPGFALSAIRVMAQRLDEAHARIREMASEEVERRIARVVLNLIDHAGKPEDEGVLVDFPISRQDIADMTGTTLHTVSRIVSAWGTQGVVEGGRYKLVVLDRDKLVRVIEPSD